jgi:hypothetical protein
MNKRKLSGRAGREPLADIQLMQEDAEGTEKQSEEITARHQTLFRV